VSPGLLSVVVPMFNEAESIRSCIESLERQSWPVDQLEVLVVDGGSTDASRDILDGLRPGRPWLRVVENPDRRASAAFNRGIEEAKGEYVCLLSAHGAIGAGFLESSVKVLEDTGAAGVGGVLEHVGTTRAGRAIALAMTSPFGMASPFRYSATRRAADTIGHPVYLARALEDVGRFDETLERNSDYELNYRLRKAGHQLLFEPSISSVYEVRSSLATLAEQFWGYGRSKAHVVRRQPRSARPRHLVAPLAVIAAAASPIVCRSRRGRRVVAAAGLAYGGAVVVATSAARPRAHDASPIELAVAFPVMHLAWGAGFVWTVVKRWR
jgi:succinoglycan biosynthesis protein ExoA